MDQFLYKYKSLEGNNFFYTYDCIANSRLFFPSLDKLNDPFEFRFEFVDGHEFINTELALNLGNHLYPDFENANVFIKRNDGTEYRLTKEILIEAFKDYPREQSLNYKFWQLRETYFPLIKAISLSEDPGSVLLWSHYANSFKGVVLAYERERISKAIEEIEKTQQLVVSWQPVLYSEEMPQIKYDPKSVKEDIKAAAFTKFSDWAYEKEHRILAIDEYNQLTYLPLAPKKNTFRIQCG